MEDLRHHAAGAVRRPYPELLVSRSRRDVIQERLLVQPLAASGKALGTPLVMLDAAKRASARRVTAVMPYFAAWVFLPATVVSADMCSVARGESRIERPPPILKLLACASWSCRGNQSCWEIALSCSNGRSTPPWLICVV